MKKLTNKENSIIDQKIQLETRKFIIRLNYMKAEDPNRNIFCINDKNEIIWQIESDPMRTHLPGGLDLDTFVSITFDHILKAKRFSGFEYEVDLETGRIKCIGWNK